MTLSSPLVQAFLQHPLGLCGQHEPAQIIGNIQDLDQRLSVLTFGTILDGNPIRRERWNALAALHDHWLFDPSQVAYLPSPKVQQEMKRLPLGAPQHLARVWWQICRGVQGRANGSWREWLKMNQEDVSTLLAYLEQSKTTFPVLSGPVISVRWLDLIHRAGGVELQGWETLRTPMTEEQKKHARLFDFEADSVHPAFISALNHWAYSCRSLPADSCGLTHCPRRQ